MRKSYGFIGLQCAGEPLLSPLYYSFVYKQWITKDKYYADGDKYHGWPAIYPCRSLKAALRHLRKHDEIPKGTEFWLVSWYSANDMVIFKK